MSRIKFDKELEFKLIKEKVESLGYKLLNKTYPGQHGLIEIEYDKGLIYRTKWYSAKQNNRFSPIEGPLRKKQKLIKYTIEKCNEFASKFGGKCLSTEYINTKTKLIWEDSKGRIFEAPLENVIAGQWSPHDKKDKLRELRTKYTIDDLKKFAIDHGGECLSSVYYTLHDSYLWKDRNGKVFTRRWYGLLKNKDLLYTDKSKGQAEIADFLHKLNIKFEENCRTVISPLELDFYIPSLNLAIEYHGLFWHQENKVGKKIHRSKYDQCRAKGIKLIQIFENEWLDRKEQVKSFLMSSLQLNNTKVYARKCDIRLIDQIEAKRFLEQYHILGSCNFDKAYGLYHNNELVMITTIGRHHRNATEWVLSRCVTKAGITVVGGLSKLSKKAFQDYGKISTWIDLRHGNEIGWIKSGWSILKYLDPDYCYYNEETKERLSKQSQKHRSNQECIESGLVRVFDAGKVKLVYTT